MERETAGHPKALKNILTHFEDEVVEFEIVPPSLSPDNRILVQGNHVGITKKALVAAFLRARMTLFANISNRSVINKVPRAFSTFGRLKLTISRKRLMLPRLFFLLIPST